MEGFLGSTGLHSKAPVSTLPKCGACKLYKQCTTPKMQRSGAGRRRVLIVGEAPGEEEDARGIPFVGKSGRRLEEALRDINVEMREDCWITNSLICRPPGNVIDNPVKIEYCRPNLIKTIEEVSPEVVILLGGTAVRSLIGWAWKENVESLGRWVGWRIPLQRINAWVCPTYHPSYILRNVSPDGKSNEVLEREWTDHLRAAFSLKGRPWKYPVPDYKQEVEVLYDADKAAKIIRTMIKKGGPVAFDYETTTLKPDSNEARVLTCSVSWRGKKTIAYPWVGEAVRATKELIRSPLPKIASNLKFEDRWTREVFGHGVRNWKWDTMLAAHTLDSRPGICSIKFQAFVLLGVGAYDEHISPYMKSKDEAKYGANAQNMLSKLHLGEILLYNGMDSLLEYKVAEIQTRQIGMELP